MSHLQIDLTSPPSPGAVDNDTPPAGPTPTGNQPTDPPICTVCLGPVSPLAAADPAFFWPQCRHVPHLSSAAQLRLHQSQPVFPSCRHPWPPETPAAFDALCHQHGIIIPAPAPARPAPANSLQPPPPPDGIIPLCCNRVVLANPSQPENDAAWHEPPDRHMTCATTYSQAENEWSPEWLCFRCGASLGPQHALLPNLPPRPSCSQHGSRSIVLDCQRSERGWLCTGARTHHTFSTVHRSKSQPTAPPTKLHHTTSPADPAPAVWEPV